MQLKIFLLKHCSE